MVEGSGRLVSGFAALVALWVLVYWWWEPGAQRVSFASEPEPAQRETVVVESPPPPSTRREPPRAAPIVETPPPPVEQPAADDGPRVIPPEFDRYVIRRGDSFAKIAQRFYGSTSFAGVIANANPMKDPQRLRPGQELLIPRDPSNVQGVVVDSRGRVGEPEPPKPTVVEYVVRPGDTLSDISRAYYGTGKHWRMIFDTNKDRLGISDPAQLRAGQTLMLPTGPIE